MNEEVKKEPTLKERLREWQEKKGLKPAKDRNRWHNMEIMRHEENGKLIAKIKLGIFPKHSFWVDEELYTDYLAQGGKPVEGS